MPKPTEPDKIPISSPAQLRIEFDSLHNALALDETEHTWEKIDKAVKRFQAVVRGGAGKKELAEDYVRGMRDKTLVNGLIRSLATERTRLSGSTLDLIGSSTRLGPQFAPLLPLYLPTLLRLLCRTNKLYINRSTTTITSIVKNTKLVDVLRFIVGEWQGESGKSASFREKAAEVTAYVLSSGPGGELQIEKDVLDRRVEELEWIIKTAAVDRDAKVRTEAKKCWEVYKREWPERVPSFTSPMTPTIRRYLNVTAAGPSAATTTNSNGSGSRTAPPVKKPRVPSALSSSVSHASAPTTSAPTTTRTGPALSRSVGPASRPLPPSISHRAPPAPTPATSTADPLSRSTSSHSVGIGPPPTRVGRAESARTTSNPSSRPASRNDDQRRDLGTSTASYSSSRPLASSTSTAVAGATQTTGSFRPAPGARAGASSAPPFKPAVRTVLKSGSTSTSTSGAPAAEPRRARRVVQEAPPAPPPAAAPVPASSSSSSTLSRSTSSASVRTQTVPSSRPHPPTTSSSAPFRPHKPTASSASLSSKPSMPTRTPLVASGNSRMTTTTTSSKPLGSTSVRSTTDKPTASTSSGVRSRREKERIEGEKKETERKNAAAEVAALEAAANKKKEQEKEEREAEALRLSEMADKAREVPLPVEEEGESEPEEEDQEDERDATDEEGEEHRDAFIAESQESVEEEVGMESEYLIESQGQGERSSEKVEVKQDEAEIMLQSGESEQEGSSPQVEIADEASLHSPEEDLERERDGPEFCSPVVEEIRLVGDLPPSPSPADKEPNARINDGSDQYESEERAEEEEEEEEEGEDSNNRDLSTESASTIGPSPKRHGQAFSSAIPDVSVALDTLALTSDSTESSLLADTTLPRSPLVATHSASGPPSPDARNDEDFFPNLVQHAALEHLPPLSPEPCQTASIVLETPPRFDDPPAQLRLPGRPVIALNFPGRAVSIAQVEVGSAEKEEEEKSSEPSYHEEQDETQESDDDSDFETASPSRRAAISSRPMPPPTPLRSVSRQRQPVFFPESASFTDIETSFEEQEETDDDERDMGRSYEVPLNDERRSDEYDDSDSGEVERRATEEDEEEEQGTPKALSKFESESLSGGSQQPASQSLDEEAAEEEEDDESRYELEQPDLRFHDETESEHEVTMEDEARSEGGQEEEVGEAADEDEDESIVIVEQPNVLKRSLRSRVVTVDLKSTSKTPSRSRSREILSELQ